jgi:hypothetical protein
MNVAKQAGIFISIAALFLTGVVIYVVTSPEKTLAFWSGSGPVVVLIALLTLFECRACLIALRLGILQKWSENRPEHSHGAFWGLMIEAGVYWLAIVSFELGITTTQSYGALAGFDDMLVALLLVPLGLYFLGHATALETVDEVCLGNWLLPITGRFSGGVVQIPSVIVRWDKNRSGTTVQRALERALALWVWVAPISTFLLVAFLAWIL